MTGLAFGVGFILGFCVGSVVAYRRLRGYINRMVEDAWERYKDRMNARSNGHRTYHHRSRHE
jgi:hypothetical protein